MRELLITDQLEEAEFTIKDAEGAVGRDAPLSRYRVRLLMSRAENTPNISASDRVAILRRAYDLALRNTEHFGFDKHSYRELCEVSLALARKGESPYMLDDAIRSFRDATDRLLDPEMRADLQYYESRRAKL